MSESLLSNLAEVQERLRSAQDVVLALDFDGTLAPLAPTPEQAAIPAETAELLRLLSLSDHVAIILLSGRTVIDLKSKISLDCIYGGNHGLEIEGRGLKFVHQGAERLRNAVDLACWDLEASLSDVHGVAVERKELTATVHYRRAPADLEAWIAATVHLTMRPYLTCLSLRPAHKAWEIRPNVEWDKGDALKFVLSHACPVSPLLICAGDDLTDEDMFEVSAEAVSIQVGRRSNTEARYHVDDPTQLATFLRDMLSLVGRNNDADHSGLSCAIAGKSE